MRDDTKDEPKDTDEAAKTAPQLSAKLRKQIVVSDSGETKSAPPLKPKPKPAEPATPQAPKDDSMERSVDLDDTQTDEAVKDIVSYEGDVMLAVADATAEERNRESRAADKKPKRGWFSAIMWTLVIFVVIVAAVFFALLATGSSVTGLK